jgi:hypothetical protein
VLSDLDRPQAPQDEPSAATLPALPGVTVALLVARLVASGRRFSLKSDGRLRVHPRVSRRDEAIIRSHRSAVVALLGLAPDPAPAADTADLWGGPVARAVSPAATPAAYLVSSLDLGTRDFTFDSLFPKQVRGEASGKAPAATIVNRSPSGNHRE